MNYFVNEFLFRFGNVTTRTEHLYFSETECMRDPVASELCSQISFETSKRATTMLCESILTGNAVNLDLYENDFQTVMREMKKIKNETDLSSTKDLITSLPEEKSDSYRRFFFRFVSGQMNSEMQLLSDIILLLRDSQVYVMVAVKTWISVTH